MNASTIARKTALLGSRTTEQLVIDLRVLEQLDDASGESRLVGAWIADEIERRLPAVAEVVGTYFDGDGEVDRTYGQMIEAAIKQLAAAPAE